MSRHKQRHIIWLLYKENQNNIFTIFIDRWNVKSDRNSEFLKSRIWPDFKLGIIYIIYNLDCLVFCLMLQAVNKTYGALTYNNTSILTWRLRTYFEMCLLNLIDLCHTFPQWKADVGK